MDVVVGSFSGFSNIENLLVYFEFAPVWFKILTMSAGGSGFLYYAMQRSGEGKFMLYYPNLERMASYKFLYYR